VQLQPPNSSRPPGQSAAEALAADVLDQTRAQLPEMTDRVVEEVVARVRAELPPPANSSQNGH
jgi:hypothetical protein